MLMLDGGDVGKTLNERQAWSTPILLDVMVDMGYDAMALSDRDAADTTFTWLKAGHNKNMQMLTGNLKDGPVQAEAWTVLEKGGAKVGVVAAFPEQFARRMPQFSQEPLHAYLDESSKALDGESVDFKVLLFHGTPFAAQKLATSRKDFDVILVGHSAGAEMGADIKDGAIPMVGPGDRGREVAFLTLKKSPSGASVEAKIIALDGEVKDSDKADAYLEKVAKVAESKMKEWQSKRSSGTN